MPELRWTLLILGVLFIAALAWWELRKPRQARRGELDRRPARESENEPAQRVYREPTINLPDVRSLPEMRPRDPVAELPVIEVSDDSMIGLRIDGQRIEEDERAAPPRDKEPILPSKREPVSNRRLAPSDVDWEIDEHDDRTIVWENEPADTHSMVESPEPDEPDEPIIRPPTLDDAELEKIETADEGEISFSAVPEDAADEARSVHETRTARVVSMDSPETHTPVVAWPDESQRLIVSLRLVASTDRFPGRAVRQALSADGFILGKMDIFHKAGDDGRAILSAASLTRPGTFHMDSIDIQRYGGLNLFAVLPGPLSAHEAFDELLTSARTLNERLQGHLQDETGQPLTPTRIAAIRASLPDMPAAPAPPLLAEPPAAESSEAPASDSPHPPP